MTPQYTLEIDCDGAEPPIQNHVWTCYGTITTQGDSLQACLDNARVELIDQHGGHCGSVVADNSWMQDAVREAFEEEYG